MPLVAADSRVLGLDLALGTTGYALVEAGKVWETGSFTLPDSYRAGETVAHLDGRRLLAMERAVKGLLDKFYPEYVAFEFPKVVGRGWWDQKRGMLTPYYLGIARGLLVAALSRRMAPERILAVPIGGAKRIVAGSPSATKGRVKTCLTSRYDVPLRQAAAMTDDESDACAIAFSVFGERRMPWET